MFESVWQLHSEASFLVRWVQSENVALWIVPLRVSSVTPFHELVVVQGNFTICHQSGLADLLSNLEVSADDETMLSQNKLERS